MKDIIIWEKENHAKLNKKYARVQQEDENKNFKRYYNYDDFVLEEFNKKESKQGDKK